MLKGEAKKAYQRGYMRDYMRKRRGVKTQPDVLTFVKTPVRPYSKEVQLSIKASKRQIGKEDTFKKLKAKYDVRFA